MYNKLYEIICYRGKVLLTQLKYVLTQYIRLIDYLQFYVIIAGEGLQNLGLCSALRAFEQGGIFIVPHLL
jgi:hypothetical protein